MKAPLTRRELDHMKCGSPGCTAVHEPEIYLHQSCHTGKGVFVRYTGGVLEIFCKICDKGVARIAVAEGPS